MKYSKIIIISLTFSLVLICSLIFIEFKEGITNPSTNGQELSVTTTFNMSDETGKLVTSEDVQYMLESSNEINLNLNISQESFEPMDYRVLFFVDYVQSDFVLTDTNETVRYYDLHLDSVDSVTVPLTFTIPDYATEMEVILIKNPNEVVDEDNFERTIQLEATPYMRYKVSDEPKTIEYSNEYESFENNVIPSVLISNSLETFTPLVSLSKSNDNPYLILGNDTDYSQDYVVMAFENWEQVPISEDNLIEFVTIPSQELIYKDLYLDSISSGSVYEVLIFEDPYMKTDDIPSLPHNSGRINVKE